MNILFFSILLGFISGIDQPSILRGLPMHHYLGIQHQIEARRDFHQQSPEMLMTATALSSITPTKPVNTEIYYNARYSKDILMYKHRLQEYMDPNHVQNFMFTGNEIGGNYLINTLIDWTRR